MATQQREERNQEATVYVGDLDDKVDDTMLWELMLQAGPVVNVHIPKDKVTMDHQGYGFVEFTSPAIADYAIKIMNMIPLFGKPIKVNKAQQTSAKGQTIDVGANLFVGNLDPEVDEKMLYDTFIIFGVITVTPKIMRDPETGESRGFGFISYDCFEASDAAIEAMDGKFFCNRQITVTYALKKGSKGERHGSEAERLLAAKNNQNRVPQMYGGYPGGAMPMGFMPPPMMAPPPMGMGMGRPPPMMAPPPSMSWSAPQ